MKNHSWIRIAALLVALSFIEPRLAYADAKADAEQAAKDIDAAYKEAQENIPNGTVKPNEDKLDEAARANDETQGDPAKDPTGGKDPAKDPAKEKAQKNEDDARDHADETNKPFKDAGDERGDKYREALKNRREACKKLKKALDELRKQLRERRGTILDPSDLEKAIRAADKAEKEQKKIPEKPKPKQLSMAIPQGPPTVATLVASGKIKVDSAGTGETIGHVADLRIQNLTDQPLTCAIPPMILESGSGKNQHYACPNGQTVALNPHQNKTVPMNGVCLNRNKPPVGKGVSGDLVMNEANPSSPQNPNSHVPASDANKLLRTCAAKYAAANQLQKSGALKSLPYRDPQKQKDIVVQWSTWMDPVICQMTGSPPATKEDLRKVVYKQVTGPMTAEKKKKVDQGIDTIFEKVELTTAKAKELEPPGPVFSGPVSTEKSGPLFKPAGPLPKPATVAQPGDVVHVEPQSPRDRPGAAAAVGAKGHWMVKVKLPSGRIVEVWFETDDKPALEFCNWIKINKTGTSSNGNTVIEDYEKTTAPTPTPTPTTPTPIPPTAPEPIPPTVPEPPTVPQPPPAQPPTGQPPTDTQSPQSPGDKTEPEKPKGETVQPAEPEPWGPPPPDLPDALKPLWEALKAGTGIVPTDLPGGKTTLGGLMAYLNVKIRKEMANGHEKEAEHYEQLKKKLQDIYNGLEDKD